MFVFVCFESQKLTKRRKQLQLCEEHCRHTKRILNTNQLLLLLGKELGRKRLEPSEWKIWIEHESGERSRYILNISKEKDWLREKRIILFGRLISYFSRAHRLLCVSGRDWPLIPKTGKDQVVCGNHLDLSNHPVTIPHSVFSSFSATMSFGAVFERKSPTKRPKDLPAAAANEGMMTFQCQDGPTGKIRQNHFCPRHGGLLPTHDREVKRA